MDPLIEIKHEDGTSSYCRASAVISISYTGQVKTEHVKYNKVTNVEEIVQKVNLVS